MKIICFLFSVVCSHLSVLRAETDDSYEAMKAQITNWDKSGLRSACADKATSDHFEFYIWDVTANNLQWYTISVSSSRPKTARLHYGYGDKNSEEMSLDHGRTQYLLNQIGQSELFHLPSTVTYAGDDVMIASTSAKCILARRVRNGQNREVFRWVGLSLPVDKVMEALYEVSRSSAESGKTGQSKGGNPKQVAPLGGDR